MTDAEKVALAIVREAREAVDAAEVRLRNALARHETEVSAAEQRWRGAIDAYLRLRGERCCKVRPRVGARVEWEPSPGHPIVGTVVADTQQHPAWPCGGVGDENRVAVKWEIGSKTTHTIGVPFWNELVEIPA